MMTSSGSDTPTRHAHALPQQAPRAHPLARAERLRDRRLHAGDAAEPEAAHREVDAVADGDAGERLGAEAPDHRRVGDAHELPAGVAEDERPREAHERAQLAVVARGHASQVFRYSSSAARSSAESASP